MESPYLQGASPELGGEKGRQYRLEVNANKLDRFLTRNGSVAQSPHYMWVT